MIGVHACLLTSFAERMPERALGADQQGLHTGYRRIEYRRGFSIAEPFLVGECDGGPLAIGQRIDRGSETPVALARLELCVGGRRHVGHIGSRIERQGGRAALRIEAEIDHETIEPRAECRLGAPARRIDPDSQQRILHDLLGEHLVAQHAPRKPERAARMPLRQRLEGPPVALRGARHEVVVGWPVHAGTSVPARRAPVAPQPRGSVAELWETSRFALAIPIYPASRANPARACWTFAQAACKWAHHVL